MTAMCLVSKGPLGSRQRDGRRPGWTPRLATVARSVRNVVLPFPIEPTHGPDVRDFFGSFGGTVQAWMDLAEDAKPVEKRELSAQEIAQRAEDDLAAWPRSI